jgi:hypothetical protein
MSELLGLNRSPGSEWSENSLHGKSEPYLIPCSDCRKDISSRAETARTVVGLFRTYIETLLPCYPGKDGRWQ